MTFYPSFASLTVSFLIHFLFFATLSLCISACQRVSVAPLAGAYQAYITKPHLVLVKGRAYMDKLGRDTSLLRDFRPVFNYQLRGLSHEATTDNAMPYTGRYQVQLRTGITYQLTWLVGDCPVETEEFALPNRLRDSVIVRNFYLG